LGLRSVKEYVETLRDEGEVYVYGGKVNDVTIHLMLKVCIDTAVDYEIAGNPQYRGLAVVNHPKTGEPISRHYYPPQNAEDKIRNWLTSGFGGWSEILAVHGEGSLQAQRMVIYHEALKNLENYKKKAKKWLEYRNKTVRRVAYG